MSGARSFRLVLSASGAARLEAAVSFLRGLPSQQPINVVAATRGAADDLVRRCALERAATFGLARFSLTQLAARLAAPRLAGRGIAPATSLGAEAVAARAAFESARAGTLAYLAGVAAAPGFPRALARTLGDLRLAGVLPDGVAGAGDAGGDLSQLLIRMDRELLESATADRARLLQEAAAAAAGEMFLRAPLLLLDVGVETAAEERFLAAVASVASEVVATLPRHDATAIAAMRRAGAVSEEAIEGRATDLECLRAFLFAADAPLDRQLDGSLEMFSAPGEGRESVEIARRVLGEARRGVRFDEMAIFVRAPMRYQGLLDDALARAGVPAWFERGTRRPHPAGRAFLALLACAAEGLSASRFAEYLSLGQLPSPGTEAAAWAASSDEVFGWAGAPGDDTEDSDDTAPTLDHDAGQAVVAGTLRAPRQWQRMLVEAAVIGGDPARWERRLDGLAAELGARLDEARRQDPASPRAAGLARDRDYLANLRAFAMPIIREMALWPPSAPWGEWLDALARLAPRTLRTPPYVLRVLADLRPMAAVGPVSLHEVRGVLADRLRTVDADPPARRYGRVFVGGAAQARGRSFRVVFVPGLAERMFPQKATQDPLLLDAARDGLSAGLATRGEQGRRERLLLHVAAGAATERLYVSYSRIDVAEARARVPSFYALDVLRGATGRIPDHERLAEAAAHAGDPTLAWPAPADPALAIDDQEHDLAVLRALLDAPDPASVRGHAQYLLRLNPALRRSVTERWARGERQWSHFDGLTRVADGTRDALRAERLGARPYSLSALQRFATCPYQFLLGAIYRLEQADRPQTLQRLDPLTRGRIVHRAQAAVFQELARRDALPVMAESLDATLVVLDDVVARVAAEARDVLVPAIERVWEEEIAGIARDLRGWIRRIAGEGAEWMPRHFELGFGLPPSVERDPRSSPDPVAIDGRFLLRGAVDLVEEHRATGVLRVTDHKTGKDRTMEGLIVGGGSVLQPVLYSMAVEQVTGKTVSESRLFFCTSAAGYRIRPVALTAQSRRAGVEALEIVDRAIERGFLAAAPAEGACAWCDFSSVCGPDEAQRIARKPVGPLRDLLELRSRP